MLVARNISKIFSGVNALTDVSMEFREGRVTAIIGENGAGKSTLMKIFSGIYTQFQGEILLNGKSLVFSNTKDAEDAGISIIHQELNLVQDLSIAENIFLGKEIVDSMGLLDKKSMIHKSKSILSTLDLHVHPEMLVRELKVGQQQLVEIAKVLLLESKVIIMDEPTSAISNKEVKDLFDIINQLRAEGKIIIYISHKLQELLQIADSYVVLRDGKVVGEGSMEAVEQEQLITLMGGRNTEKKNKLNLNCSNPFLTVNALTLKNKIKEKPDILTNISFKASKGEIIGIYGLMGSGRTELLESLFGLHGHLLSGDICINGRQMNIQSAADAVKYGFALVPEDRKKHGLHLEHTIRKNISMSVLNKLEKWGMLINEQAERQLSAEKILMMSVKTNDDLLTASNLSGGNQQKVVLAKWLSAHPSILLLDEPTRGVDVHSKSEIHELILQLASEGMTILTVSSEIPEILTIADRILVMCEGQLTLDISGYEANELVLLTHAIPGGVKN